MKFIVLPNIVFVIKMYLSQKKNKAQHFEVFQSVLKKMSELNIS